ncbi:MAG TPA: TIGR02466 family protein [Steroidobacteraceae bacterium]|nr:TIGR02466 family protein [Steroidobacteraceae bacterium]
MTARALFPTLVYSAPLQRRGAAAFNQRLLRECRQLRLDDAAGRDWSRSNYPGGYTSYGSQHRLYEISPTFARLRELLVPHVGRFARTLEWDLRGRRLAMTDCWVNIMPRQVVHSLHLHPLSTLSGTYYVQVPRGAPGIKFEDPRLERFMAAPPRRSRCRIGNRPWVTLPASAGSVVLFESWLRHEVTPNPRAQERISISFNFSWF